METYAQIKQSLKKLRLTTIAETIEHHTKEAIDHQLSYIDVPRQSISDQNVIFLSDSISCN